MWVTNSDAATRDGQLSTTAAALVGPSGGKSAALIRAMRGLVEDFDGQD